MTTKIESDDDTVHIDCPHCGHWEQHPVDEQRHHLQTFDILDWGIVQKHENEVSQMECHVCRKTFSLEWDYENILK